MHLLTLPAGPICPEVSLVPQSLCNHSWFSLFSGNRDAAVNECRQCRVTDEGVWSVSGVHLRCVAKSRAALRQEEMEERLWQSRGELEDERNRLCIVDNFTGKVK